MIIREEKKLLVDIIEAINSIDDHLEHQRNLDDYLTNKTKRRAVEREIEIIGEAMANLLKINPTISISYARVIVNLRNDDILIWKIIMKDIPLLLEESQNLLHEN